MKQMHVLKLFFFLFFFSSPHGMEKSPRDISEASFDANEYAQVQSIVYRLESEASYANPHAAAHIHAASLQLLDFTNKPLIIWAWHTSAARSNAASLLENSQTVMRKCQGTALAIGGQQLYQQAQQIFLAI